MLCATTHDQTISTLIMAVSTNREITRVRLKSWVLHPPWPPRVVLGRMAAKGCPWENGYQESFYSQFKIELGDPTRFKSLGELTACIYKQIHYYNNQRLHTSLNMAPSAFARQYAILNQVVQKVS